MTTTQYSRRTMLATLLLATLCASGCVLSSAKPREVVAYPLDIAPKADKGEAVAWQLAVDVPLARGPIAEDRIAIRDVDGAYSVLANARWSHEAPELVQDAIIRSFEDAGRVPGVVRSSHGVRGDYRLLVELRTFEADPRNGWSVSIEMSAKLVRMRGMKVVASQVFRARTKAKSGAAAIVAAFGSATGRVIDELRVWVIRSAEADWGHRDAAPRDGASAELTAQPLVRSASRR